MKKLHNGMNSRAQTLALSIATLALLLIRAGASAAITRN
jgi:hypothetical protein